MKFSIMATERTNNFTDPAIQAKITGLWEKNSEAVKKAAEKGTVIACVYHEYESNYQETMPFRFVSKKRSKQTLIQTNLLGKSIRSIGAMRRAF